MFVYLDKNRNFFDLLKKSSTRRERRRHQKSKQSRNWRVYRKNPHSFLEIHSVRTVADELKHHATFLTNSQRMSSFFVRLNRNGITLKQNVCGNDADTGCELNCCYFCWFYCHIIIKRDAYIMLQYKLLNYSKW